MFLHIYISPSPLDLGEKEQLSSRDRGNWLKAQPSVYLDKWSGVDAKITRWL